MSTAQHDADAMLIAWRKGRADARNGKPEKPASLLALLPTDGERDAYLGGYRGEKARAAPRDFVNCRGE